MYEVTEAALLYEGEEQAQGDGLTWAMAIYRVLTEDQQRRVREYVRETAARRKGQRPSGDPE